MKKLFALFLAIAMILTLTACGDKKDDDNGVANKPEDVAKAFVKAETLQDVRELKGLYAYDYEAELKDETIDEYGDEETFFEEFGEEIGEEINSWNSAYAAVKKMYKEQLETVYGKYTLSVSAVDTTKMDEDALAALKGDMEDYVSDGYLSAKDWESIKEGATVRVKVVIDGEEDTDTSHYDVCLVKIGSKWKVVESDFVFVDDEPVTPQPDNNDDDEDDKPVTPPTANVPTMTTTTTMPAPSWEESTTTTTIPEAVRPDPNTYNAGYIDYDEYINEWANLYCSINNGWELGTEEEYATYENSVTECGLYLKRFNSTTGAYDLINIVYEYMQGGDITATDYMSMFASNLESTYTSIGYTVDITDPVELRHEGRNWIDCTIYLTEASLYQRYMVTEQDGYMISLIFTTKDSSALDSMLNKVNAIG